LKKKGRDKVQLAKKYNFRKIYYGSSNFTCFGYGKQGHIKIECLNVPTKDKGFHTIIEKNGKTRKAYTVW